MIKIHNTPDKVWKELAQNVAAYSISSAKKVYDEFTVNAVLRYLKAAGADDNMINGVKIKFLDK